jgi:hypothetical protein
VVADGPPSGADDVGYGRRLGAGVDVLDHHVPGHFEAFVKVGKLVPALMHDRPYGQCPELIQRVTMPQFNVFGRLPA